MLPAIEPRPVGEGVVFRNWACLEPEFERGKIARERLRSEGDPVNRSGSGQELHSGVPSTRRSDLTKVAERIAFEDRPFQLTEPDASLAPHWHASGRRSCP